MYKALYRHFFLIGQLVFSVAMIGLGASVSQSHFPSQGPPSLTINVKATTDLDSSNAFEGPEKLLEVWFAPAADALPFGVNPNGLKAVSPETWKEMLDLVNCKVLSTVKSEHTDAYLLSESSMFVFPHKLILKTCGTTTLLLGLPRMLQIAASHAGFSSSDKHHQINNSLASPYRVFYSRKNFLFPDRQRGPHRSWKNELEYLDSLFMNGSAYMVGKMNGDHWYLYLTTPNTILTPPRTPDNEKNEGTETRILNLPSKPVPFSSKGRPLNDETLEVLMTDLDPDNAKQFYLDYASTVVRTEHAMCGLDNQKDPGQIGRLNTKQASPISNEGETKIIGPDNEISQFCGKDYSRNGLLTPPDEATQGHTLGTLISERSGLSQVYPKSKYPDARIDAYLFSPCGFSANGVIPALDGATTNYITVHVTPEPQCSYASFESNVPTSKNGCAIQETIEKVVNIFKPGRFSVTFFEAKVEHGEDVVTDDPRAFNLTCGVNYDRVSGYRRIDRIVHELDGYQLVFRYYERLGWHGGSPRLGEIIN